MSEINEKSLWFLLLFFFSPAIRKMLWSYPRYSTTSLLSLWTELSSGLNLSCVTKEQSTWDQLLTISPGTSTTPWMFWHSCSPVQPLLSSFFSSAAYVAVEDVAGLQRGKQNRHLVPISPRLIQQGIYARCLVNKFIGMCFKLGISWMHHNKAAVGHSCLLSQQIPSCLNKTEL